MRSILRQKRLVCLLISSIINLAALAMLASAARGVDFSIVGFEPVLASASAVTRELAELPKVEVQQTIAGTTARPLVQAAAPLEAVPHFLSYREVHDAAMARGGYRPGQRVAIAICANAETKAKWARRAQLEGFTFCTEDQETQELPCGILFGIGNAGGKLCRVASFDQELASNLPRRVQAAEVPLIGSQVYYTQPVYQSAPYGGGACAGGDCAGGACAGGACGGGGMMQGGGGGGFFGRLFGGGCLGCGS